MFKKIDLIKKDKLGVRLWIEFYLDLLIKYIHSVNYEIAIFKVNVIKYQ